MTLSLPSVAEEESTTPITCNGNDNDNDNDDKKKEEKELDVAKKALEELLGTVWNHNNNNNHTNHTNGETTLEGMSSHGKNSASVESSPSLLLQQARLDLQRLQELQIIIQEKISEKLNLIESLQLKVSPLWLFFCDDEAAASGGASTSYSTQGRQLFLLSRLVSYLDQESLWKLELSMPCLLCQEDLIQIVKQQWDYLDTNINPLLQSNAMDCTSRERGIRFVLASKYAQKIEQTAKYHYTTAATKNSPLPPRSTYEWPDTLYTKEDFWKDFRGYDDGDESPPQLEFFIRVSYQPPPQLIDDGINENSNNKDEEAMSKNTTTTNTRCLFEGFFSDYADLDRWDGDMYAIVELGDEGDDNDDTSIQMVCSDIYKLAHPDTLGVKLTTNWRNKLAIEWPPDAKRKFLQHLSVTVLACEPPSFPADQYDQSDDGQMMSDDDGGGSTLSLCKSHLVVSTSGYKKSTGPVIAVLPPRPILAQARSAELSNCVSVGIKLSEERSGKLGFRIMVGWGKQEVLIPKKSLLYAFAMYKKAKKEETVIAALVSQR